MAEVFYSNSHNVTLSGGFHSKISTLLGEIKFVGEWLIRFQGAYTQLSHGSGNFTSTCVSKIVKDIDAEGQIRLDDLSLAANNIWKIYSEDFTCFHGNAKQNLDNLKTQWNGQLAEKVKAALQADILYKEDLYHKIGQLNSALQALPKKIIDAVQQKCAAILSVESIIGQYSDPSQLLNQCAKEKDGVRASKFISDYEHVAVTAETANETSHLKITAQYKVANSAAKKVIDECPQQDSHQVGDVNRSLGSSVDKNSGSTTDSNGKNHSHESDDSDTTGTSDDKDSSDSDGNSDSDSNGDNNATDPGQNPGVSGTDVSSNLVKDIDYTALLASALSAIGDASSTNASLLSASGGGGFRGGASNVAQHSDDDKFKVTSEPDGDHVDVVGPDGKTTRFIVVDGKLVPEETATGVITTSDGDSNVASASPSSLISGTTNFLSVLQPQTVHQPVPQDFVDSDPLLE